MSYTSDILISLQNIVGTSYVFTDDETRKNYGHDETEDYNFPPQVVVKPKTPEEISAIMKLATEHTIPVTPIGAKTGLSGGALSIYGGIGLSMERFNSIIGVDDKNLQVIKSEINYK